MSKRCVNPSRGRKQALFVLPYRNDSTYRTLMLGVRSVSDSWFYRRGFAAYAVTIFSSASLTFDRFPAYVSGAYERIFWLLAAILVADFDEEKSGIRAWCQALLQNFRCWTSTLFVAKFIDIIDKSNLLIKSKCYLTLIAPSLSCDIKYLTIKTMWNDKDDWRGI